jgi:hypothetical protein
MTRQLLGTIGAFKLLCSMENSDGLIRISRAFAWPAVHLPIQTR